MSTFLVVDVTLPVLGDAVLVIDVASPAIDITLPVLGVGPFCAR